MPAGTLRLSPFVSNDTPAPPLGFLISEAVMPDIIKRVYSAKQAEIEDVA